ncbi:tRNA (adenosine(37)-N6)-threonylcarbamoyltransferase complex dimerization subunit type 1 TsaB [Limosilactobacillus caecicola]|uniref:tRNA (adenosine(37)-N6)-threonylcarbamoyltransferase complex dimerization subunit type 1 TsaB n=1 Tax=Limosilactobacillus caecicola TaxID=2941332 RepID=UPI00203EBD94|nr:tRNA (adenosine(37)-N6)-threonylcarbamoyltransferase complex dimerization subunit type 1 TsaB [Limosilactobacillus caecicola]
MKILALDTSNQPMSVALVEDDQLKATTTLNMVRNHSIYVLPTINELFEQVSWEPADLDRVVVAQGPGSYTGVRIAVTTAKALAMTLQKELVGVSSLAVLAANVPPMTDDLIVPFMDARRGNVFAGGYQYQNGRLVKTLDEKHIAFQQLLTTLQQVDQHVLLVGQDTPKLQKAVATFPDNVQLLPEAYALPSTYQLAVLGRQEPVVTDLDDFVPNYLRLTEAEVNWLKDHPGKQDDANYVQEV